LYVLLTILCVLRFCIVLCTVSPHTYSCLFSICVWVYWRLPPGGNPTALHHSTRPDLCIRIHHRTDAPALKPNIQNWQHCVREYTCNWTANMQEKYKGFLAWLFKVPTPNSCMVLGSHVEYFTGAYNKHCDYKCITFGLLNKTNYCLISHMNVQTCEKTMTRICITEGRI
jgi:hypothetical protein